MLSKSEIEYLNGKGISTNYSYVLEHRIAKKLNEFQYLILPALLKNEKTRAWLSNLAIGILNLTGNSKNLTEFCNVIVDLGAGTAASQGLTHLTNTTATTGLTSGFGMGPGRTPSLWPAK